MSASILRAPANGPSSLRPLRSAERRDCAIDLVHLSRQTLGDRALETELLRLFDRQCAQILAKLQKASVAGDRRLRQDLAHTLKGSARAVGAGAVAEAAERYELELETSNEAAADAALATLQTAMEEVRREVGKLLTEG